MFAAEISSRAVFVRACDFGREHPAAADGRGAAELVDEICAICG
jgi:hypothetical protein